MIAAMASCAELVGAGGEGLDFGAREDAEDCYKFGTSIERLVTSNRHRGEEVGNIRFISSSVLVKNLW